MVEYNTPNQDPIGEITVIEHLQSLVDCLSPIYHLTAPLYLYSGGIPYLAYDTWWWIAPRTHLRYRVEMSGLSRMCAPAVGVCPLKLPSEASLSISIIMPGVELNTPYCEDMSRGMLFPRGRLSFCLERSVCNTVCVAYDRVYPDLGVTVAMAPTEVFLFFFLYLWDACALDA